MLADGTGALWVLPTIAVKMAVGIAVGYAIDGILKAVGKGQEIATAPEKENETPRSVKDIFLKQYEEEKEVQVVCGCGKTHGGDSAWSKYLWYPLLHTLQVAAFIFLVNFVLTAIIHTVGEENFASFMQSSKFLQPFLTSAIGLIPNCASSVVLTETFLSGISAGGGITFGSFVAGLCANAGMGYVVLLKNTKKWKRNLLLIACSYLVSVAVGLLINLLPIA
jgi:hypothetical protein